MALQKQVVSMNLGRGMDNTTDVKVGPDNDFNEIKDFVYPKLERIDKRPGTQRQSTTVQTSFPNPLSIGTSAIRTSTFANRDELMLQNRGALYSLYKGQAKWEFKGHYNPIEIDTKTVASDQYSLTLPDSATVNGITVCAYLAFDNRALTLSIRYCVIEESTGAMIADDILIESWTANTQIGDPYIRIVTFSSAAFITWVSGTNLRITKVNLTDGSIGAISSLQTDVKAEVVVNAGYKTLNEYPPDFCYANKVAVGERNFCAYYTTGNNLKVFSILNTGAIDTTMGSYSVADTILRGMSIYYNTTADRLFIGYQDNSFRIISTVLAFTTSAITLGIKQTVQTLTNRVGGITQTYDPATPAQTYLFYDEVNYSSLVLYGLIPENKLYKGIVSSSAVILAGTIIGRCLNLFGKAFTDTLRSTIYLPCCYTRTQSTLFLIDVLKGKNESALFVQGKWLYGLLAPANGGEPVSPKLSQVTVLSSNTYQFAQSYKSRITGSSTGSLASLTYFRNGISRSIINLAPTREPTRVYLGGATHLSGGYLGYYDGSTFCESGFFLNPEGFELLPSVGGARISFSIVQGGGGVQEVTTVACQPGSLQLAGPSYWTFNDTITSYYVWYRINGVGTDPGVGGATGMRIDLTGTETAAEVAQKNVDGINFYVPRAVATNFTTIPTQLFVITNNLTGAATDASAANYSLNGTMEAGTYQYSLVFSWPDVNGQLVRSAPSIAQSVIVSTANSTVGIVASIPPLTNRVTNECFVEIYRTQKNGTTMFRLTSFNQDIPWSASNPRLLYTDNVADSFITGFEPLYTTGGIIENYQIPACKNLSIYKNRIIASGIDDNTLYYSKTAQNGAPIEFTAIGIVRLDNDKDPITAHVQIDDKLGVFKKNRIIYLAGDGINDAGGGSNFSQPITIPSDVGCVNQNSVALCKLGALFKSEKGIYLLDRSMQTNYIGWKVKDYNQYTVSRAELLSDDGDVTQIRFCLQDAPYTLVFDYETGRWAVFSQYGGTDACIWQSQYVRVDGDGFAYVEDKTVFKDVGSTTPSYSPTFQTQWIQAKDVQDYQRVYRLGILGALKSAHTLQYQIYYDYDETNYDSYSFNSSAITGIKPGDSVYQPIIHLKRQKCEAMKIRITVVPSGGTEESLTLTDMSFEIGMKQGMMKVKAAKKL